MDIPKAKVYHDGGHPIAIIPTTRPVRRKTKKSASSDVCTDNNMQTPCIEKATNKKVATAQLKDTFAWLYKETASMSKVERNNKIIEGMREHFKDETQARLLLRNIYKKRRETLQLEHKDYLEKQDYKNGITFAHLPMTTRNIQKQPLENLYSTP